MSPKNNILFITQHPSPYWDVTFRCLSSQYNLRVVYLKSDELEKPWLFLEHTKGIIFNISSLSKVIKELYKSEIVIIGGILEFKTFILFLISKIFNKRIGLFSDVPYYTQKKISFKRNLKVFLYSKIDFFLIAGKRGIEIYSQSFMVKRQKIFLFPYGWDQNFRINKIPSTLSKPIKVFTSNRFIKRKGYDVLFKALEVIESKANSSFLELTIAGNGPEFDIYYGLSTKFKYIKFNFIGWVEYEEYYRNLNNCEVYLHCSLFEPYGIPVPDALNLGKLVISSNMVMSANDFIINNFNGIIYNYLEHEELAKILLDISENQNKYLPIMINAKNSLDQYGNYLLPFFNYLEHLKIKRKE